MAYEKHREHWLDRYPAIEDLRRKAQKRIPNVAWQYLETGTGREACLQSNLDALNQYRLTPKFCKGPLKPKLETELFGVSYSSPFGIAPIGLSGLIWPSSEEMLARSATRNKLPYALSTVATETPEKVGEYINDNGWFQLYPPKESSVRKDLLKRAWEVGFRTLLVTADVPTPSRRERAKRAGFSRSPKITPAFIWQGLKRPAWSLATLKNGLPRLKTIESYADSKDTLSVAKYLQEHMRGSLTWEYCKTLRDEWQGPMIIKGILHEEDAILAASIGFDGVLVSNHGGRQFDGAPASLDSLATISAAVGDSMKVLFDSGVRSGLDVLKAMSLGADFVLAGRAFMYGVAALGEYGADHVMEIFNQDLTNNMIQLGIESLDDLAIGNS